MARAIAKRQTPLLLLVGLAGWLLMMAPDRQAAIAELCLSSATAATPSPFGRFEAALAANALTLDVGAMALSWLAMLMAMMPSLLTQPISYLQRRSLPRRRGRAIAVFALGYIAVWLLAGAALMMVALALGTAATAGPAFAIALIVALAWQIAPPKQRCLNRCHRQPRLSAFGLAADADALRYGISHGLWCVGACWALMLLPLVAGRAHLAVMAAVTLLLVAERYRPARPARWGFARPFRLAFPLPRFKPPVMRTAP